MWDVCSLESHKNDIICGPLACGPHFENLCSRGCDVDSYLDLAMSVLIRSTFFCFSWSSSGLRGVLGSISKYRSGIRTFSGVDSCRQKKTNPSHSVLELILIEGIIQNHCIAIIMYFCFSVHTSVTSYLFAEIQVVVFRLHLSSQTGNFLSGWLHTFTSHRCLQTFNIHLICSHSPPHLDDRKTWYTSWN